MTTADDRRREGLLAWANDELGRQPLWSPASADASFRRYFRGVWGAESWIAMDAPPAREDNAAFVRVAGLLADAGINAPRVLASDMRRGFLLLSDLGRRTYLDVLGPHNAGTLFDAAIEALIAWQRSSNSEVLPGYERADLAAELALFRDWYLPCHLRHVPTRAQTAALDTVFEFLLDNALAQARVFVHRDYMPRNLMVSRPLPGVLDFQDARYGPVTYDIVSLFQDAFISWPKRRVNAWLHDYWTRAKAAAIPVAADFETFNRDAELMAVQRHLKVLGYPVLANP